MIDNWDDFIQTQLNKEYFQFLDAFLEKEANDGKIIFPAGEDTFKAFDLTPLDEVRVVIIGQDPYSVKNRATGLAFSVSDKSNIPPSLRNIFKELKYNPSTGDLTSWAKQGVLLLNTILTVEEGQPLSHEGKGWETFTSNAIKLLNTSRKGIIFLAWGRRAQALLDDIGLEGQIILRAAHPSPLSARNGFFGCDHFNKVNEILAERNEEPIIWKTHERNYFV